MSNLPKLRFPEFSDPWLPTKAGKYFELLSGFPFKSEDISEDNSGIPILRGVNITEGKIRHSPEMDRFFLGDNTQHEKYIVQEGDIVLGMDGSKVGKNIAVISSTDSGSLLIQRVARLRDNRIGSLDFIFHHIFSYRFHRYVDVVNTSSGIPHISAKQINEYPITAPSKPEQQKIAAFLTAVDTKIEQLTQKEALLKQYKKGVMQKIFSQEIRFKADDGSDFPEWLEEKLGNLCKIATGKLDANAMKPEGQYRFYTCAKEHYLIDEYAFDTDALIISGNGANVGYVHHYCGKFNAYQRTYVLDDFKENIVFIKYLLDKYLKRRIGTEKNEGNTPYIVMGTLVDMPLLLPCREEQFKIAEFFAKIDLKIEQAANQLTSAKTFKKGLLQQMFV